MSNYLEQAKGGEFETDDSGEPTDEELDVAETDQMNDAWDEMERAEATEVEDEEEGGGEMSMSERSRVVDGVTYASVKKGGEN